MSSDALEELEDAEHNVVHVAEARGLGFLGMVETARPVNADIRFVLVELHGAACKKMRRSRSLTEGSRGRTDRAARGDLTIFEHAIKDRAILTDVD